VKPTVSIIVPCYNYEHWLLHCVNSLIADDYDPKEIIIVHDGCKEPVLFQVAWKNVVLPTNDGVAHARNEGFLRSTGEYIWFLDADDMAIPGGIAKRVDYLEKHTGVDMVWADALKINEARGNWRYPFTACLHEANCGRLERYSRRINAQTLMWRRSALEKHGLYYENLRSKEDKEMLFRYGQHPDSPLPKLIKARKLEYDCVIYRRHPDAKHKKRVQNKAWYKKVDRTFQRRIKQLQKEGITRSNTRFSNG